MGNYQTDGFETNTLLSLLLIIKFSSARQFKIILNITHFQLFLTRLFGVVWDYYSSKPKGKQY